MLCLLPAMPAGGSMFTIGTAITQGFLASCNYPDSDLSNSSKAILCPVLPFDETAQPACTARGLQYKQETQSTNTCALFVLFADILCEI